jgi:hypothetical protein
VNRFLCVAFFFREREVKHVVAPKTVWFLDWEETLIVLRYMRMHRYYLMDTIENYQNAPKRVKDKKLPL